MAGPLRGGGDKDRAIKENITFGWLFSNVPKFQRPLSSRAGGGLGLNGPAIKRRTFLRLPLGSTLKEVEKVDFSLIKVDFRMRK